MTPRRVAIVGGSGQLGTALRAELAGLDVIAPAHADVSLEDREAVVALLDAQRPDVLVNCAAFHNVDTCEREPDRAFAINALAVDRAAQACSARDVTFVTVSTDYVFDGFAHRPYREDDAVNPRTAYGASKAAGESLTRRHGERHLVVRTSGVFGTTGTSSKGYTLLEKVLLQAERGEPTRMVDDMVFSPSYAPHVARTMRALIEAGAFGTHHVTNSGACTWYELVRHTFRAAGLSNAPLEPIAYAALRNPTRRPAFSPLENTTLAPLGIQAPPPWPNAVDEFLAARSARLAAARS